MKFSMLIGLLFCFRIICLSQDVTGKFSLETVASTYFNSNRHEYRNGEQGIYKEFRAFYRINKYIESGVFAGHQWRSFIYYKLTQNGQFPYYMDRQYIPAGINFRVYVTDIFSDKLNWIKRKEKWDVYSYIFLCRLFGKDERDPRETNQDNIFYQPAYVIEYGKIYSGVLLGLTHYPLKNFGIFLEAGEGAIAYLQVGIKLKM